MARKRKSTLWPKCAVSLCDLEADYHVDLRGDQCAFLGYLCDKHYDAMHSVFPTRMGFIESLRPIFIVANPHKGR